MSVAAACTLVPRADWASLQSTLRTRHPAVPQIGTRELAALLDGSQPPLLVDVRARAEYEVSHLPGAQWGADDAAIERILASAAPGQQVVLYCAVGYRSTLAADRLIRRGHANVVNLEGSLFQWANEERPLERHGRRVGEAHPFDAYWGRLLDRRWWPRDWREGAD